MASARSFPSREILRRPKFSPVDFAEVLAGIVVMSFYVVVVNRLLWRPLYHLAETKYSL